MTRHRIAPELRELIIADARRGYAPSEISRVLRQPYSLVVGVIKTARGEDVSIPRLRDSVSREGRHAEVIELYRGGVPYPQMAQRTGLPVGTIATIVRKEKLAGNLEYRNPHHG